VLHCVTGVLNKRCQLNKTKLQSLDFISNRLFVKFWQMSP